MGGMEGGQNKNTPPLRCTLKNFKKGFHGHDRVKLTPYKLRNSAK
jgi:hypothetical protein